jgi:hypothetical protein
MQALPFAKARPRTASRDRDDGQCGFWPEAARLYNQARQPCRDRFRLVAVTQVVRADKDQHLLGSQVSEVDRLEPPQRVLDSVAGQAKVEDAVSRDHGAQHLARPCRGKGVADQNEIGFSRDARSKRLQPLEGGGLLRRRRSKDVRSRLRRLFTRRKIGGFLHRTGSSPEAAERNPTSCRTIRPIAGV